MARRDETLAMPDPGDWRYTSGWFALQTATYDDYPSLDQDPWRDMRNEAVAQAYRRLPDKYQEALDLLVVAGKSAYSAVDMVDDVASRQTLLNRAEEGKRLMRADLAGQGWGRADVSHNGEQDGKEAEQVANPSKAKGTRRETTCKRNGIDAGLQVRRSENALEGRDLDVTLNNGDLFVLEVKDRQRLNVHKTYKKTADLWDEAGTCGVIWHRTKKKDGAKVARPVGPTLMCFSEEDGWDMLATIQELSDQLYDAQQRELELYRQMEETDE